jgi:hypothetical protein
MLIDWRDMIIGRGVAQTTFVETKPKVMQTETNTLQVVSEFVNAVKVLNLEKVGALLHPEVEWDQPGNNRFSGIKRSSNEVFGMVGGMFEVSQNSLTLADVKSIAVNGNQASVMLQWKALGPKGALDVINIDHYTVADGQITAVKVFTDDLEQEDLFWGLQ